ncbi:MAG: N-acetylmuramoyl-L-alanine amidase [Cyanobacteria bacterium J06643_5]
MYFGIDIGHNCPPDTGAVSGIHKEDVYAKQVGELIIKQLKERGHRTAYLTPIRAFGFTTRSRIYNSLLQRARKANSLRVDYFVSIHFNAFSRASANGSEVLIYSRNSSAKDLAQEVLDRIVALGFRNRRVKAQNLVVLRETNMPAMLVECCFLTNDSDMERFNPETMATAIVNGLVGEEPKPDDDEDDDPLVGVLRITNNTLAKPSTEQSGSIPRDELFRIKVGEYKGKLLADEEGHYAVELEQQIGDRKVHYIYSGHAEFIGE